MVVSEKRPSSYELGYTLMLRMSETRLNVRLIVELTDCRPDRFVISIHESPIKQPGQSFCQGFEGVFVGETDFQLRAAFVVTVDALGEFLGQHVDRFFVGRLLLRTADEFSGKG